MKPQWKEKIAFFDPRGSGAGEEVASYLLVKFGEKFILDLIKSQNVGLTRSYSQIADWLAQGKYAVGIAQVPDRIEALRKEGVPLRAYSLTDAPGTLTGGFSVVSLFKNSPNPNAATVFINWILTKTGQDALMRPQLYPSLAQRRADGLCAAVYGAAVRFRLFGHLHRGISVEKRTVVKTGARAARPMMRSISADT